MKKIRLILLLTTAIMLSACDQKEYDEGSTDVGRKVALRLGSGISASITRAYDTTWDAGDAIGVFTTKAGTTSVTKSGSQNDENIGYYTTQEAQTYNGDSYNYRLFVPVSPGVEIYLPADGSAVDVYAYSPRNNSVTASNPLSISVPTTQTSALQKGVDVMKAKVASSVSAPVDIDHPEQQLLFEHVMTKVLVYVMAGTGYGDDDLSGDKVSSVQLLGQPTSGSFAPISQELSITSGSSTITMEEITDSYDPDYVTSYTIPETSVTKNVLHVYRAIIFPNNDSTNPTTSGTERQIKFNVGATNYTYDITQTFSPGSQTVFAMRLSATGLEVNAAIQDWTHETITPNPLYPQDN